jgi:Protein of unknown function (DUF1552)
MDRRWLVSRRALLGGVGALGLTAMLPRSRAAAASTVPTRFLFVHVPEGMWSGAQRPVAGAATLGPILGALDPYKDKLTVLDNLFMKSRDNGPGGDGHHRGVVHMLTGIEMKDADNAGGISVDQKIAAAIGGQSTFASLQFAARIVYNDTNSRPIWSAPSRVVPAVQDPWEAYKRIFGGAAAPAATATATTPAVAAFDLRRSALDYAMAELPVLRAKLPASDRDRLDSYQESLRDIERRLDMMATGSTGGGTAAAGCTPPTLGASINVSSEPNFPKIAQLQMDLIVASFQCNVTRVASLQLGNSNDQNTYSWLGVNTLGHDLSHNNSNCDPTNSKKLQVYQWFASQFAYLMGKLKAIPEADGSTMLDNTVVLWASEFGDSNGHNADKLMWVLMGNAGGAFKTGQVVNCGGRSVNDLHVSLLNAFGVSDASFGNPAYCQGALPQIMG